MPEADDPRAAIVGYLSRFIRRESGMMGRRVWLSLNAFNKPLHEPAEIVDIAGDLARDYLQPTLGTSLHVHATDTHIIYELPEVVRAMPVAA